jgi:cell division septation protein DedD
MKKIFILNLLLLCSVYSQDLHEFSLHVGGGLSTLRYEPTLGEQSNNFNKQFGAGYAFFVSPRFGFATGLELAFYSADFELKKLRMAYKAEDLEEGVDFEFRSNLSNYTEEQNAVMLQIPVMLQFQTEMGFYLMAGVKFALPLSGGSSGKGDLMNSGYYEDPEKWEYTEQGFRGFGSFKNKKTENHENFESSIFASMEMGMKWRFEDGLSLYAGAYFDYGLGNILKKKDLEELPRMVEYNSANPQNFGMNGIFDSQWEQNKAPQAFVTKIMPMAIGIKVKLSLSQGVDYFANKDKEKLNSAAELKRVEAEKQLLELNLARSQAAEKALLEREAERLAAAEKLLQEARFAYERALIEQNAVAMRTDEVTRLAAETAQIEQEVERLSSPPDAELEVEPSFEIEQDTTHRSGEWVIQVAVVMQKSRAGAMVNSLKRKGFTAYYKQVVNPGRLTGTYYRVRVGYFSKSQDASEFAKAKLQSYKDWWLDKTDNDTK